MKICCVSPRFVTVQMKAELLQIYVKNNMIELTIAKKNIVIKVNIRKRYKNAYFYFIRRTYVIFIQSMYLNVWFKLSIR